MNTISYALDLIQRQQAEIDRLNIDLKAMRGAANSWKAEVQRICKREFDNIEIDIEAVKSEAVKGFAERLKNEIISETAYGCDTNQHSGYYDYSIKISDIPEYIDNLVKEMGCNDG